MAISLWKPALFLVLVELHLSRALTKSYNEDKNILLQIPSVQHLLYGLSFKKDSGIHSKARQQFSDEGLLKNILLQNPSVQHLLYGLSFKKDSGIHSKARQQFSDEGDGARQQFSDEGDGARQQFSDEGDGALPTCKDERMGNFEFESKDKKTHGKGSYVMTDKDVVLKIKMTIKEDAYSPSSESKPETTTPPPTTKKTSTTTPTTKKTTSTTKAKTTPPTTTNATEATTTATPTTAASTTAASTTAAPTTTAPTTAAPTTAAPTTAAPTTAAPTTAAPTTAAPTTAAPTTAAPTTAAPTTAAPTTAAPTTNATSRTNNTTATVSPTPTTSVTPKPQNTSKEGCKDSPFIKEGLAAHNQYRAIHSAPSLKIDCTLSKQAADYAQKLADLGSLVQSGYSDRPGDGENLGMECTSSDAAQSAKIAVKNWYDEVCKYKFSEDGPQKSTDHFTQVVWKASQQLGLGMVQKEENGILCTYVVARYKPQGNFNDGSIGYTDNVLQGTFDESYCNSIKDGAGLDGGYGLKRGQTKPRF